MAVDVARRFGVPVDVSTAQLAAARANADRNRVREERRAPETAATLEAHLRGLKVKVVGVRWLGAHRGSEGTAVDLEIDLAKRGPIGYQLKSVEAGKGTNKNIGRETIERWLDVDLADLDEKALADVVKAVTPLHIRDLDGSSFSSLHGSRERLADRNTALCAKLDATAKKAYLPHKYRMTKILADAFNRVAHPQRVEFVLKSLAFVDANEEYLLVHDARGPHLFDARALVAHVRSIVLMAEVKPPGNSFRILGDGVRLFRVNSSAANHQGLSPLCARAFYQEGGGALLTDIPILRPNGT